MNLKTWKYVNMLMCVFSIWKKCRKQLSLAEIFLIWAHIPVLINFTLNAFVDLTLIYLPNNNSLIIWRFFRGLLAHFLHHFPGCILLQLILAAETWNLLKFPIFLYAVLLIASVSFSWWSKPDISRRWVDSKRREAPYGFSCDVCWNFKLFTAADYVLKKRTGFLLCVWEFSSRFLKLRRVNSFTHGIYFSAFVNKLNPVES